MEHRRLLRKEYKKLMLIVDSGDGFGCIGA